MNRTPRFLPLLLALAFAAPAFAQAPSTGARGDAALPAWEQLTPEQRELLVAPLRDRWNRDPDQRARMLEHASRWQAMPAGERERARRGMRRWEGMSPQQRDRARALFEQMKDMDAAQRKDFLAKWKAMTPQQHDAWLQAHPAPPHRHGPLPPGRD